MFSYFHSPHVRALGEAFRDFFYASNGTDLPTDTRGLNIRQMLFDFFKDPRFSSHYSKLALEVANNFDLKYKELGLQKIPTPRVFRPGDHGTSLHCDYWYGHGEKSVTVWVPLTATDDKNTFQVCREEINASLFLSFFDNQSATKPPSEMKNHFFSVTPSQSECVVFDSKLLHSSERNDSINERISFDFRISDIHDPTSTKNLNEYFVCSEGGFVNQSPKFSATAYLKYICGGPGRSTTAQHLLIERVASEKKLSVIAQEAELERFGHPMLNEYLNGLCIEKSIDGILIASKSILTGSALNNLAKSSGIEVYCCLEDEFLTRI
jgi:hypothetical protein